MFAGETIVQNSSDVFLEETKTQNQLTLYEERIIFRHG